MLRYFFRITATGPDACPASWSRPSCGYFLRICWPRARIVVFVAAILGNVLQVGFLFTVEADHPGRLPHRAPLRPVASSGRSVSDEALFNLAKNIVKIAVIVRHRLPEHPRRAARASRAWRSRRSSRASRLIARDRAAHRAGGRRIALLVFAALDYWFQRRQHLESLKMSRQEVKEERKMYEGDPLVRSRLRERMREIMRRNMLKAVPKADVVITNPTHYAVALEYEPPC